MKKGAKSKLSPQLAFATNPRPDGCSFIRGGVKERLGHFRGNFKYWCQVVEGFKTSLCRFDTGFGEDVTLNCEIM